MVQGDSDDKIPSVRLNKAHISTYLMVEVDGIKVA